MLGNGIEKSTGGCGKPAAASHLAASGAAAPSPAASRLIAALLAAFMLFASLFALLPPKAVFAGSAEFGSEDYYGEAAAPDAGGCVSQPAAHSYSAQSAGKEVRLEIAYRYADGTEAAPTHVEWLAPGDAYEVESPPVPDYEASVQTVRGTAPRQGGEIDPVTVIYMLKEHADVAQLDIIYQYEDGREAWQRHSEMIDWGKAYAVESPPIAGYVASIQIVQGVMERDVVVEVVYSAAETGGVWLEIAYRYADGTEAAPPYARWIEWGQRYAVESPAIAGYGADIPIVEGDAPDTSGEPIAVTVTYAASGSQQPGDAGTPATAANAPPPALGVPSGPATSAAGPEEEVGADVTTIPGMVPPPAGFTLYPHDLFIIGYPDGSVRPQGSVTRAETSIVIFRLLSDTAKDRPISSPFSDVEDGAWHSQAISYLADKGIVNGYPDGSFRPDAPITRAEFSKLISGFDSLVAEEADRFADTVGHWASGYINSAAAKGWVNGYPDGDFRPGDNLKREEIAAVVNRMLHRRIELVDLPPYVPAYTDLDTGYWAYCDFMEASVTHNYRRKDNGFEIWLDP